MAGFDEIGTGLAIMILVINLFLAGFGGIALPQGFDKFIPDQNNISLNTFRNDNFQIGTIVASSSSTDPDIINEPFDAIASYIGTNAYEFFRTLVFGITIFAIGIGAPLPFIIAIIIPLNIIMILYVIGFVAGIAAAGIRGLLGL